MAERAEHLGVSTSLLGAVALARTGLWKELTEIDVAGPRAQQASMAALAVAISVTVACTMHLPEPWWAAISGFISTQATRPASVTKGVLRIIGTVVGAAAALLLVGWLAYDQVACCVALFIVCTIGILALNVSPHGYAWLFFSVTFSLVLLMSLVDPLNAFDFAAYRTFEVVIGTIAAIIVATTLAPEGSVGGAAAPPGWTDLLGARWPAVLHAVRGGIAVAVIPVLWSYFYLPGLSATATTVASVLAVPVLADHPLDSDRKMVERAIHRLLGCFVGGIAALALLAIPLTEFLPWLVSLAAGTWLFAFIQSSSRGIGYLGTQAAVVFMLTLVQGDGAPTSIMPALDRFAGITIGMTTLFVVCLLLEPATDAEATQSAACPR
jgi:uncharacterized membrane protein YccC